MATVAPSRDEFIGAIVAALGALEAGDLLAVETILLGALEDGSSERPHRCVLCGSSYRWPGELERHLVLRHTQEQAA